MLPALDKLADPLILAHALAALLAVAGGITLLAMRKGTSAHRLLGRVWVLAMLTTAVSSLFMRAEVLPVGRFGPIHLLSLMTIVSVSAAVWAIRRGDVAAHRRAMTRSFVALAVAGLFALAPGRALNAAGHELLAWVQGLPAALTGPAANAARAQPAPARPSGRAEGVRRGGQSA